MRRRTRTALGAYGNVMARHGTNLQVLCPYSRAATVAYVARAAVGKDVREYALKCEIHAPSPPGGGLKYATHLLVGACVHEEWSLLERDCILLLHVLAPKIVRGRTPAQYSIEQPR